MEYERGVRGKVHGARTDFRWIAQSAGFGREGLDLHSQLNLGAEDLPECFQAWRNIAEQCFAMTAYPSRAIDAEGRRGFLEKQVLEWRKPPGMPATLAALFLLPRVSEMTDEIWWDHSGALQGSDSMIHLSLPSTEHDPIAVDEEALAATIERGRHALRETVDPRTLAHFYDQLLTRRHPACLFGLRQPLPPDALAALLLPLPREIADRISLAGWIPSSRPALTEIGSRWEAIILAADSTVPSPSVKANEMANSLLTNDRSLTASLTIDEAPPPALNTIRPSSAKMGGKIRPGLRFELEQPAAGAPPVIRELYEFATAVDRRWLSPDTLKNAGGPLRFRSSATEARLLCDWIKQVQKCPPHANEKQWDAKIDLLRSAAIVLVPEPSTMKAVGLPATDSPIPVLLFGLMLDNRGERDALAGVGAALLRNMLEQSTRCRSSYYWNGRLRTWLSRWQRDTDRKDVNVEMLIAEAVKHRRQ
ncbi:MAG TPA: hypothetical protein VGQ76_14205 [Thermoanaerobaculia bacterium]|nr:hypothetical protein [Thermoanaerobaculia bacterium]